MLDGSCRDVRDNEWVIPGMEPRETLVFATDVFQQDLRTQKHEKCRLSNLPTCQAMENGGTKNISLRIASLGAVSRLKKLCSVMVLVLQAWDGPVGAGAGGGVGSWKARQGRCRCWPGLGHDRPEERGGPGKLSGSRVPSG